MKPMLERDRVTRQIFEQEIVPAYQPVVMRGVVADWPMVKHSAAGMEPVMQYLMGFDHGAEVDAVLARPDALRSFGYAPGLDGFNFVRDKRNFATIFEQLWRYSHFDEPPCLAAQSALISEALPGLEAENPCHLLTGGIAPRIWIGNRVTVPAHFDDSQNVACVGAGRRRFTLLAPQCAPLLYLGPPEYAPTAAPMTVASLHAPDFERFPLLRQALEQALVAELGPGDAIYIPPLWFHQVESLDAFNILVNYWWRAEPAPGRVDDSHIAALRLAMLAFRHLPDAEREGWRALLDHYVFGARPETLSHLPLGKHGLLGEVGAALDAQMRKDIINRLSR